MLIAICGIDGSGKTTQINLLKNYIKQSLKNEVYITKQPTDFYRKYDQFKTFVNREEDYNTLDIVYELALLSATDKLRHYTTEILPNNKDIIISDRYVFSAYAYFLARGIKDIGWLKEINKFVPLPDITIYIDISPKIAYERIVLRDGKFTKKEETDIELLSKVRGFFINQPWGEVPNYHIVQAKLRSQLDIHEEIKLIICNSIAGL